MGIGGIVSAIAGLSTLAGAFSGASAAAASGGGIGNIIQAGLQGGFSASPFANIMNMGGGGGGGFMGNTQSPMTMKGPSQFMGSTFKGSSNPVQSFGQGIKSAAGFLDDNPLITSMALQLLKKDDVSTPASVRNKLMYGHNPDIVGRAAPDRRLANGGIVQAYKGGGMIRGPGTGTSDSIPAMIYQDGSPVREAALSDGEFVVNEATVRRIGNGNRNAGAAELYKLQQGMAEVV
jgi:hypothetical protein